MTGCFNSTDKVDMKLTNEEMQKLFHEYVKGVNYQLDNLVKRIEKLECNINKLKEDNIKLMVDEDLKLEDYIIKLELRIDRLENSPFGKSPTYIPIFERIDKLESNFDNLSMTFDAFTGSTLDSYQDMRDRIEKLEEQQKERDNLINYKSYLNLVDRIGALENFINKHWSSKRHEPHKCPVCDGSGRYKLATAQCDSDIVDCHSCEGKGIVWG